MIATLVERANPAAVTVNTSLACSACQSPTEVIAPGGELSRAKFKVEAVDEPC